jgi:low temperature requirement protein LtrA
VSSSVSPQERQIPVKWLELFYDLVFVAAVVTFSDALTHAPSYSNLVWVVSAFAIVWLVWFGTTFGFNRDHRDEEQARALVVVQMAALSTFAIALGEGPGEHRVIVATSFAVILLTLAGMNARSMSALPEFASFFRLRVGAFLAASACSLLSLLVPLRVDVYVWCAGLVILAGVWTYQHATSRGNIPPIDEHHLSERLGLLTIIVLGESLVKLSIVASTGTMDAIDIEVALTMFVCLFGVFWAYFDDVPVAGLAATRLRRASLFSGHLVLQVGCVGLAIGLVVLSEETTVRAAWTAASFACYSVAAIYVGLALAGLGGRREPIRALTVLRLGTAVFIACLGPVMRLGAWTDPNAVAFIVAALMVVHGGIADRFRDHTTVAAPAEEPAAS